MIDDEMYQGLMENVDVDDIFADIYYATANGYDDEEYIKSIIKGDLDNAGVDAFFIDELTDLIYANWLESQVDDEDDDEEDE